MIIANGALVVALCGSASGNSARGDRKGRPTCCIAVEVQLARERTSRDVRFQAAVERRNALLRAGTVIGSRDRYACCLLPAVVRFPALWFDYVATLLMSALNRDDPRLFDRLRAGLN